MTPDDVAAIRARLASDPIRGRLVEEHLALCDALEAAWAERDALAGREKSEVWRLCQEYRERAERAEADVESLQRQNDKLDEALSRVRDLCEEAAVWTEQGYGWTTVDEVRAAIDDQ